MSVPSVLPTDDGRACGGVALEKRMVAVAGEKYVSLTFTPLRYYAHSMLFAQVFNALEIVRTNESVRTDAHKEQLEICRVRFNVRLLNRCSTVVRRHSIVYTNTHSLIRYLAAATRSNEISII